MTDRHAGIILILAILFPVLTGGEARAVEQAAYSVIEKHGDIEIRHYWPLIIADTVVEGDFREVGDLGFRRLHDYISGGNIRKLPIPLVAPVSEGAPSEKIAMTAPVSQEKAGDKWRIGFLMPSEYTMDTLPEPLDKRVVLREVPARIVAAITYSGTWSGPRYENHKARLEAFIRSRGLKPAGGYIFARYNPPYMIWFLRRNEVLVPVEPMR
jgi:hypothetical protein